MSTVNGKSLSEVLSQLGQKKYPTNTLDNGVKYFSSEEYVSTFDAIVGVGNYNVEYTDFKYTRIRTDQELFSVKCTITIIDDDGKPLLKKECYGGYTCRYNKKTGQDVNLQNSADFVCTYAFKTCAKKFGIFGKNAGSNAISSEATALKEQTAGNNKAPSNSKDVVLNFYVDMPFEQTGTKDNRPKYKLSCHLVTGDNVCQEGLSDIIFYPNQYSKCADKMHQYVSTCGEKRMKIRMKVKQLGEQEGRVQYCFKDFVPVA